MFMSKRVPFFLFLVYAICINACANQSFNSKLDEARSGGLGDGMTGLAYAGSTHLP